MKILKPPGDYLSWLDYAVATIDARGAYLDSMFDGPEIPSLDDVRVATLEELNHLRRRAAMPWFGMLDNWQTALSKRLGRPAEVIVENGLLATDFSGAGVHISFEDGTDLTFRRAFYLGETPSDGAIHRVAVFTEHCGYHEFRIGPDDRIEVNSPKIAPSQDLQWEKEIRQSQAEIAQGQVAPYKFGPASYEELAWDNMAPLGREFGSPDYDRLMAEDAAKFASDLQAWIKISQESVSRDEVSYALKEFANESRNIQQALGEFGQDVSVESAAAVWIHYSKSLCAGWMVGADTVRLAARSLYIHCPRHT